ncbi:MAG: Crp/Fnr family transcriptional regulator [Devosia sp.]|jgi:CRP-like cAMP-binding protein|nr:Crp/Fnr family transcriptional regulator [Devosia sp.]
MKKETTCLFRKLQAIGDLTEDMKAAIDAVPMQLVSLEKGQHVISDGETASQSCLLLEGLMHRSKHTPHGERQILSLHIPGDIPDLHGFHLRKMDHNLVATVPCEAALIAHVDIKQAIERSPDLNDLFWRETLLDAATFRAWVTMMGQTHAISRISHILCELYVRWDMIGGIDNNSFPFPLSQQELADVMGTSMVHASHTMQNLQQRGLIHQEAGRVFILDWPALRNVAQFEPAYLHYLDESRLH